MLSKGWGGRHGAAATTPQTQLKHRDSNVLVLCRPFTMPIPILRDSCGLTVQ